VDISISTTIFGSEAPGNYPLEEALRMIRDAGYPIIEFSRKHRDLAARRSVVESLSLTVWAVHGTLGYEAVSSSESARRGAVDRERARLEDAAAYAPCPYVVHYLHRSHDGSAGRCWRKSMEEVHRYAASLDINLAVETFPHKPQIHDRYADSREIAEFVRSFGSAHMSVCVDINHSNVMEDLGDVTRNCEGLISNIHVSDNHGDCEEHLPPGEGTIDICGALRALIESGYGGPCNLECHIPGQPTVEMLVEMRGYAERCVAQILSKNTRS